MRHARRLRGLLGFTVRTLLHGSFLAHILRASGQNGKRKILMGESKVSRFQGKPLGHVEALRPVLAI
jgi:hypothetical protein